MKWIVAVLVLVSLGNANEQNERFNNYSAYSLAALKAKVPIGILLPVSSDVSQKVKRFTWGVDKANAKRFHSYQPVFHIKTAFVSFNDSFLTMKSVCDLVHSGVMAVYGENLEWHGNHAASILNFFNIPFIQSNPSLLWEEQNTHYGSSINLFPSRKTLTQMLFDVIDHLEMENLVIFYYDQSDILLWKQFIDRRISEAKFKGPKFIHVEKSAPDETIMTVLTAAKKLDRSNLVHVNYFDSALDMRFLRLCQFAGLLRPTTNLILAAIGIHFERVLKPYMFLGANITVFSAGSGHEDVVDEDDDTRVIDDGLAGDNPQISEALFADALTLLSDSLTDNDVMTFPLNLSCSRSQAWHQGRDVVHRMLQSHFLGQSGLVRLDGSGRRSELTVKIRQLTPAGQIHTVGHWDTRTGLMWQGARVSVNATAGTLESILQKGTLVITTLLSPPYTMVKLDAKSKGLTGVDRYEGFVIDLATLIAEMVGFNFTIHISDGYGSIEPNGEWNGMIRDLLEERADLAMADLSISYEREQVVDFTMPFLDLGISLLYVKAPEKSVNYFAFLSPLSANVWLLMILGGFVVSLSMYWIARMSPYETEELRPTEGGETPFLAFHHCLWFAIASWVQQGCDFLPRALSSRTVASFWWFFTLIMISSYTANLAAFLTIERMDAPIDSAADLASQTKIQYGAVKTGSTIKFFKNSKDEAYAKLGRVMARDSEDVLMDSNQDGVDRVIAENGGYAFFMESTSIEYQVERNCILQKVGGNLDSKSYGIALPQGSPLRSAISSAIIRLNEQGKILDLKEKWWKKERGGGACEEESSSSSVNELNLTNVGGIFLVLLAGVCLGGIMAVTEHFWEKIKTKYRY